MDCCSNDRIRGPVGFAFGTREPVGFACGTDDEKRSSVLRGGSGSAGGRRAEAESAALQTCAGRKPGGRLESLAPRGRRASAHAGTGSTEVVCNWA